MRLLTAVYSVVQRLVLLHQFLVALRLGTIIGIDDHIIVDSLAPDSSGTARHVIVAIAVTAMVGP